MSIMLKARSMEARRWVRGLVGAGISGGASAASAAVILPSFSSEVFTLVSWKFYAAILAFFMVNAMTSVLKFLANEPLPGMVSTEKNVVTVNPATADAPASIETFTEKTVKPIAPE